MAAGPVLTRVIEAGSGPECVVFIHGTGGRAERWVRNLQAVADAGFRAVALDLPGHGFAAKGEDVQCSVPAYRRFLGDCLDALGIDRAALVGTSLGGHVVASYALDNPGRVSRIALVGSMGLVPIGDEARLRVQAGANNQTRDGVASKLRRVIHDSALVTPELEEEEYRVNNSPGAQASFATLGRYIAADLDRDVIGERLAASKLPVLLVWGEQDKTVPPSAGQAARALLPQSRLVLLADAAHTAYYERPDDFNRILIDFARATDRRHEAPGIRWQ